MRYLITGGSGFIGSHLARWVPGEVFGIVQPNENPFHGHVVDRAVPVDVLFHLGAITDTTITDREQMFYVNVYKSIQLFSQVLDLNPRAKIVYASSCSVYGAGAFPFQEEQELHPLNCYAESKLVLEHEANRLARERGAVIIGLRLSNVFGSGEAHKGICASVIGQLYHQMRKGIRPFLFKHGEQFRDWVYVQDVVKAFGAASGLSKAGIFNIGSGETATFNVLVSWWNEILGSSLVPSYIDNPYEGAYQARTSVSIDRAKKDLAYYPMSIKDGMRRFHSQKLLA